MANKYEKIGKYTIYLDQMYYLSYAGGHRELPVKQQKDWDRTLQLPGILKVKEQNKLGLDSNPNVVPLTGMQLMSFIRELHFVPFFDRAFESTHVIQLTDRLIYESIRLKSYDVALKNGNYNG
jgi:hypothetical protein